MSSPPEYEWHCDRCTTSAFERHGGSVNAFAERHYAAVHPLFTAEVVRSSWRSRAVKPKRRRMPLGARPVPLAADLSGREAGQ